ncbi:Aldo/keto reductase family protein [Roseicitreum antarcticum]|uniref:Aldo/keto reductase family protein n=1 Tax=Roseicitreum antarcticum TaxID=564137 RepID=A0A1H3FRH2_9RHOB|nr:Aldo/keto reductase family protein [Roseicitreum antarcticum]
MVVDVFAAHLIVLSAMSASRRCRLHPVIAVQTEYSLWSRGVEGEVLPTCQLGIGFVPYSPLAAEHGARKTVAIDTTDLKAHRAASSLGAKKGGAVA